MLPHVGSCWPFLCVAGRGLGRIIAHVSLTCKYYSAGAAVVVWVFVRPPIPYAYFFNMLCKLKVRRRLWSACRRAGRAAEGAPPITIINNSRNKQRTTANQSGQGRDRNTASCRTRCARRAARPDLRRSATTGRAAFSKIRQMYYVLFIIYYILCTMYYVLCTAYYVLCSMYYILCTMRHVLCIMCYVLCTMYYVLCMYYLLCTM